MLGLFLDNNEIKILPQRNTFYPQLYPYDFNNADPETVKGIHTILS